MRRTILMVVATMSLLGTNAMADNFTFSFGTGANTVTGEIFGLKNDGVAHPATEVLITSYPASLLGTIPDLDATQWDDLGDNLFTEVNGKITFVIFDSLDNVAPLPFFLELEPPGGAGQLSNTVEASIGLITYTPAPVPEPSAWILFLTVMLAVAIVKRTRRTDGLNDPAIRMRS